MNMPPPSDEFYVHQIILDVPEIADLRSVPAYLSHSRDLLIGDHVTFERDRDGNRVWKRKGVLVVNMRHVGKLSGYKEF